MIFIKTTDGSYINANQIKSFHASETGKVHAYTSDDEDVIISEFDTNSAAQEWLEELIDELERDDD